MRPLDLLEQGEKYEEHVLGICELVNTNTPNPFPCLMLGGQTCQFRSTDNVLGKNK